MTCTSIIHSPLGYDYADKVRVWYPPSLEDPSQRGGTCGIFMNATVLFGNDEDYKVIFDGENNEEDVR